MSTLNWLADLGNRRAAKRAAAARVKQGGSPPECLPPPLASAARRAELRAEIRKVGHALAAVSRRELDPALEAEAAWFLAQLRAQAGEYEEKLSLAWRWNLALAMALVFVSTLLIATTWLGQH